MSRIFRLSNSLHIRHIYVFFQMLITKKKNSTVLNAIIMKAINYKVARKVINIILY